jgi:hypothetical protein
MVRGPDLPWQVRSEPLWLMVYSFSPALPASTEPNPNFVKRTVPLYPKRGALISPKQILYCIDDYLHCCWLFQDAIYIN